jgi:ribosome-interacting GTPase 1
MTRDEEIEDLERKLKKREGKPGFAVNVDAIKARLAELRNDGN